MQGIGMRSLVHSQMSSEQKNMKSSLQNKQNDSENSPITGV